MAHHPIRRHLGVKWLPALLLGAAAVIALALTLGSAGGPWLAQIQALIDTNTDPTLHRVIWELRWPRVAGGFAVGAMLALSGALMQVLLRNPLADPYVLGTAGGASVATLIAITMGAGVAVVNTAAFVGALLTIALVFGLSLTRGSVATSNLLLTGVVLASLWGAMTSFLLVTLPNTDLSAVFFWLLGDLSRVMNLPAGYLILAAGMLWSLMLAPALNILTRGELNAAALGVNVNALRLQLFVLSSLLCAGAVTLAGPIGFIGLVIPHALRFLSITDHRALLPASALAGGSVLVLADLLARTAMAPRQLPVGVMTAAIGVPVFLWLLRRGARA